MRFPYFRYAISLVVAAGIFAGCGGGGKSLVPGGSSQQSTGQSVPVTFTVTIGSQSQTQSTKRNPQFIPSSTQSLVIDYIGNNPSATPAPGATPPANVTTAATINVTASTTNPPPVGDCFASNGTYTCTISLKLPVGILDLYVLAYAGQNGTGLLLSGAVVIAQVNANGTVTQPGSSTPISIALTQKGEPVGTASLGSNATIVPNGVPKPSVAAPSYPTNTAPYVYSAAETVAVSNPSGTPIPAGTPISSITVTDNESGGASCLVYIPNGATTATPCPFATSASSVTLQTSGDSYALLYNGQFVPAASISITGSVAGSSTVPTPISVAIRPSIFSMGSVTTSNSQGPVGAAIYDPLSSTVYAAVANPSTPMYAVTYGQNGFSAPSPVNVVTVNGITQSFLSGAGAQSVQGGAQAFTIGPDNNIWMLEHNGEPGGSCCISQYVAVAVLHTAAVNPLGGPAIQPAAGAFAEYQLFTTPGSGGNATTPLHSITSMGGFIWVVSKDGAVWRINPTTGLVSPNLATGYLPGTTPNQNTNGAQTVTDPTGANPITPSSCCGVHQAFFSPIVGMSGELYLADYQNQSLDALSVDTSTTPSTGLCSPPGSSPCIATYTITLAGSLLNLRIAGGSDATSLYNINSTAKTVYKVTPPSTVVTSSVSYTSTYGGLMPTSDGWLWTLEGTVGAQALTGLTAGASVVTPTAVPSAVCESLETLKRGASPFVMVPNGTLVFSPSTSGNTGSFPVLCGVVY